jgi:hypothetical protein
VLFWPGEPPPATRENKNEVCATCTDLAKSSLSLANLRQHARTLPIFSPEIEKREMPPKTREPEAVHESSSEVLVNLVLQALAKKLDLDGLAQQLVAPVTERLVESITLADLAEAIAAQHRDEIKTRLARAVLDRVRID